MKLVAYVGSVHPYETSSGAVSADYMHLALTQMCLRSLVESKMLSHVRKALHSLCCVYFQYLCCQTWCSLMQFTM